MRQFKRHDAILIVVVKPLQKTIDYSKGRTSNFSRDGCCFESQGFNPIPSAILEFKFKHPHSGLSVSALGEIVWKREAQDNRKMGIKFSEIEQASKDKLLEILSTDRKHTELIIHGKASPPPKKNLPKYKNEATDNIALTMVTKQENKRRNSL